MNWFWFSLMFLALMLYFVADALGLMGPSLYPAGW